MRIAGISLTAALLLLPILASAQEEGEGAEPMKIPKKESWTDLTSKSGVKVQYKYAECHDNKNDIHKENLLLRFQNTKDEKVHLEWDHLLWYDGKCKTCGGGQEYHHRIVLEAGEVLKGDCAVGTPSHLQVFASYLKKGNGLPDTELTGLRLDNLQVK